MFVLKDNHEMDGTGRRKWIQDIFGNTRFEKGDITWFTKDTALHLMNLNAAIMYRPYLKKLVSFCIECFSD